MEHYREGQYDDDLTVDVDNFDDDFGAGAVDLFDFVGDDDSPLARLKSIILSIDWEITDDILRQFNEELIDLKDIWADNKINLIYVQLLEKLSKYIYKEKADAHPNAIKLLMTFYTNLEKVVSTDDMPDEDKKALLMPDVQRFEKFKKQIGSMPGKPSQAPAKEKVVAAPATPPPPAEPEIDSFEMDSDVPDQSIGSNQTFEPGVIDDDNPLLNLKAIVYGIDWEITERDLDNLSREVSLLEKKYQSNKAKLIFLQGLGSIGAYINLKRSDSHADAFKLLHSFFIGLEKIIQKNLSADQEKSILMPEVQKFNAFKKAIAETVTPDVVARGPLDDEADLSDQEVQPAFSDVPDNVHGFNEDEQIASPQESEEDSFEEFDGEDDFVTGPEKSESELANEMESRLSGMFTETGEEEISKLDSNVALQGVDVESEADDDSEEEPLPEEEGELIPALAADGDEAPKVDSPAVFTDHLDDFFTDPEKSDTDMVGQSLPGSDAVAGSAVEDDLTYEEDEFSPALSGGTEDEAVAFDTVFDDEDIELQHVDDNVETFFDDPSDIGAALDHEEPVAALEAESLPDAVIDEIPQEKHIAIGDEQSVAEIEDKFDNFFGDETVEAAPSFEHAEDALKGVEVETEADDEAGEEPLAIEDGELIPALSDGEEPDTVESPVSAMDESEDLFTDRQPEVVTSQESEPLAAFAGVDSPVGAMNDIEGVDVESPEDDDSDEEPLSIVDGELAPALSVEGDDDAVLRDEEALPDESFDADVDSGVSDVSEKLDSLFGDEDPEPDVVSAEEALQEVYNEDLETPELSTVEEGLDAFGDDSLFDDVEESTEEQGEVSEEQIGDNLDELFSMDEQPEVSDEENLALVAGELDAELEGAEATGSIEPQEVVDFDDIPEIPADDVVAIFDDDAETLAIDEFDEFPDDNPLLDEFNALTGEDDDLFLPDDEDSIQDDLEALSDENDFLFSTDEEDSPLDGLAALSDEGDEEDESPIQGSAHELADDEEELFFTDNLEDTSGEKALVDDDDDLFSTEMDSEIGQKLPDEELEEESPVVFEPVTEDEGSIAGLSVSEAAVEEHEPFLADATDIDDSDTFGTVLLSEEPVEADETQAVGSAHNLDLDDIGTDFDEPEQDEDLAIDFAATQDESVVDAQAYVERHDTTVSQDNLKDLRNCIVSLGLEIDNSILAGLTEEIETLRHTLMSKPLEKTFLQLLSTIAQHIENFKYDADPEANKLLLSVFDKLELSCMSEIDSAKMQEVLLTETSKVLQWQQKLLDRKPVSKGDSSADDSKSTEKADDSTKKASEINDTDDFNSAIGEIAKHLDDDVEKDALMEKVSMIMKEEVSQLKDTFRLEFQELKKELTKDRDDD